MGQPCQDRIRGACHLRIVVVTDPGGAFLVPSHLTVTLDIEGTRDEEGERAP
jgi:hypothetical protein